MQTIGIVAGGGGFPGEVADAIVATGNRVHVVIVDGVGEAELDRFPHTRVHWSELSRAIAALKGAGARRVILLGTFARPKLSEARADIGFLKALPKIVRFLASGGDDAVLRGLLALFEDAGLKVAGVGDVAPTLIAGDGVLAGASPGADASADIALAMALIGALGRFDIGQAAVVRGGQVVAIEGAEGTDAMLARVAARQRGRPSAAAEARAGVLVKCPKPEQDLRVDMPAIGPATVGNAADANLAGIAVAAGKVLVARREEVAAQAAARGLFVVGRAEGVEETERGARRWGRGARPVEAIAIGRLGLARQAREDVRLGLGVMQELAAFDACGAVVARRRRVLSIGGLGERAGDVLARTRRYLPQRCRWGVLVLPPGEALSAALVTAAAGAGLSGIITVTDGANVLPPPANADVAAANGAGMFVGSAEIDAGAGGTGRKPLNVFIVAGEHSGDALGGKLMAALKAKLGCDGVRFAGVGGHDMAAEGLNSLFAIEEVAVMGPAAIVPALPGIVRRVYRTVDAAVAAHPDVVVIIDSPEFSHPIAKRIRKRAPHIPIVDYVCPSVWAWRPWRARKMRGYVDHVLALLPFEPDALKRLAGPASTYVGHPLVERLEEIRGADATGLARRLGVGDAPVLLVLPGSRRSEVERLIDVFGETVGRLNASRGAFEVVIPAVAHVRDMIAARTESWPVRTHIVEPADKYAAMRLARAALAASGTVTLELAIAGVSSVVAYRVDRLIAKLRFLLKVETVVLANLVIGSRVYPEYLQEACTADNLAAALQPLLGDGTERAAQLRALATIDGKLTLSDGTPSEAAAAAVLAVAAAGINC